MTLGHSLPRPLSTTERSVLRRILSAYDGPGAAQLVDQCDEVLVVGGSTTMLELRAAVSERVMSDDGLVPVRATVVDDGSALIGEILVWVADGALSALEYAWYTDQPPTAFPSANQLRFEDR